MTREEIQRAVGPTKVDRDTFAVTVSGWAQETWGCACTACAREWLRVKALGPGGWTSRANPEPQDPRWHLRDATPDQLRERVRRIFG